MNQTVVVLTLLGTTAQQGKRWFIKQKLALRQGTDRSIIAEAQKKYTN